MALEVTGIDHLYVSVSDFSRAVAFYDPVMRLLGFRKGTSPIAGEAHAHYFNRETQYTLRPAKRDGAHDPYAPGLHHLCFRVATTRPSPAAVRSTRPTTTPPSSPIPTGCALRSWRCAACVSSSASAGTSSRNSRTPCRRRGSRDAPPFPSDTAAG